MSFDKILKKTMKWEGGFVNDVHDRGGATKYGITLGTIQALNEDIDQDGRVDINDIHKLTIKQASSIYERVYFMRPKFHLLPQTIQPVVFDMGVNHGPSRAVKILQKVINTAGITTISGKPHRIRISNQNRCSRMSFTMTDFIYMDVLQALQPE